MIRQTNFAYMFQMASHGFGGRVLRNKIMLHKQLHVTVTPILCYGLNQDKWNDRL